MAEAEAQIRAIIDERIAAIRAKDARAATACVAEDVVAFELAPPLALPPGAAADVQGLAAWLSGFAEVDVEVRDLAIEAGDRVAFARALHHLTGRRTDGRPVSLWMRSTLCFRREEGGWRVAHAHTSVPFHKDGSFRAAVHLEP
ncbi:MAG TPA: nuclear transport factor 2 family protein [Sphingomicrobium sp.]